MTKHPPPTVGAFLLRLAPLALAFGQTASGFAPTAIRHAAAPAGDHFATVSPAKAPPGACSPTRAPLAFETNEGQFPEGVEYTLRGCRFLLDLREDGFTLLPDRGQAPVSALFEGASPGLELRGLEPLPHRTHYLFGPDPRAWRTDVANHRKVLYEGLYPGIDLVFYGNPDEVEYDFHLAPGADPDQIQLRFPSARPSLDPDGALRIDGPAGELKMKPPTAYQPDATGRSEVESGYVIRGGGRVGFRLGAHDPARPLVIDPVLLFSSYFGGGQDDQPSSIAVDAQGNQYVAGTTQSVNLPSAGSPYQAGIRGGTDAFVSKFGPSGSLLYTTYIGGSLSDSAEDIAIDGAGNAYVAGSTSSTDFPTARPASAGDGGDLQTVYGGGPSDGYLLKLNPAGSALLFSTYIGGTSTDQCFTVAVDSAGAALAAGSTTSRNFPLLNAFQGSYGGGSSDGFVVKYDVARAARTFATYLGGRLDDFARAAAFDASGAAFVAGYTRSNDFPTAAAFQESLAGGTDVFVSKFPPDGSELSFSTYLGGASTDLAFAMALDAEGNPCLTGETSSSDFPVRNAVQSARAGGGDVFLTKMAGDGASLIFSTYLGGSGGDSPRGIAIGREGDIFVTGGTASSNFPAVGTLDVDPDGVDAFLSRFSPRGGILAYSTYLIGERTEIAADVGVDAQGNAYVLGAIDRPGLYTLEARQSDFAGASVYRSRDRAVSWGAFDQGIENPNVTALAVDPSDSMVVYAGVSGEGVFKSLDGGASWAATDLEASPILTLVVDPADSSVVYATTSGSVFKTTDGGENWEPMIERLPPFAGFQALAIDPHDSSTLYVGTSGRGVFKSTNGAESWRAINNGLDDGSQQVYAIAVDRNDSNRVYLATFGAVFFSSNGGSSWQPTSLAGVDQVSALAIDPQEPNTLYAASSSQQFGNIVARTSDGGLNWRAIPTPGRVASLRIDPENRTTLYAGTSDAGVLKSVDAGSTWQLSNTGLATRQITALAAGRGALYAGTVSGGDAFLVKVAPERIFYFPQIGDGVEGRIRFRTTFILVNAGGDTNVTIEFFDAAGDPLQLTLGDLGEGSTFQLALGRGQAFSAETPGEGPLTAGYARIRTPGLVGGTAVFSRADVPTGQTLYETGVPASFPIADFSLLLDSLGNRDSGVAVVNATPGLPERPGDAEILLTLLDRDSNFVGEAERSLAPGQYFAQFITEMFPEIVEQVGESQGTLAVSVDQPVAAVSLRQNEDPVRRFPQAVPTLTALPVILPNSGHLVTYFPQIGDGPFLGSLFQTSLIFANTGFFPAVVTVDFFDSAGEPLELTLGDLGTESSFQIQVQAGGFVFLQTSGGEELQVGYARVTSNSGAVGGTAVFSERDTRTGVLLYEAGVPAATPFQEFSLYADSIGIRDTGLAMVNPDPEAEAVVTLRLYDETFNLVSQEEIRIGPGQHRALLLYQLFPNAPGVREFRGVLTAESDRPLAAVTLRSSNDITRAFPATVPTLTAFPITPSRARP